MVRASHVIFEREGILVDCNKVEIAKNAYIFKNFDRHCPSELRTEFQDGNLPTSAEALIEGLAIPITKTNFQEVLHNVTVAESWRDAHLKLDAKEIVDLIAYADVPMAVVSSTKQDDPQMRSPRFVNLWKKISHTVCVDDHALFFPPPEPDIFLLACKRFKGSPHVGRNILAFVSSAEFARAAMFSGCLVVWVIKDKKRMATVKSTLSYSARTRITFISKLSEFQPSTYGLAKCMPSAMNVFSQMSAEEESDL